MAPIDVVSQLTSASDNMNYADIYHNVFRVSHESVAPLLKRDKNPSRIIVKINGKGAIHRALLPDGSGGYFILINNEICKQYNLEPEEDVRLSIHPDNSEYGMPLPTELEELWAMDEEAYRIFHQLTPGKQRGLIYMIGKPKGSDTRIKKAVQIHEYLKSVNGKLEPREMNAYIKADNANWK